MLNKLVLSVCLVLSSIVGNVGTIVRSFSCIQSTQILAKQISDQRLGWLFGNLCCFIYCKHCRFNSRPLFSSCGQQLRLFGKFLPIHSYYCLFFSLRSQCFLMRTNISHKTVDTANRNYSRANIFAYRTFGSDIFLNCDLNKFHMLKYTVSSLFFAHKTFIVPMLHLVLCVRA